MTSRPSAPLLHVTVDAGRTVARFVSNRLTEETAEAVGRAFDALVSGPDPTHLSLDLGDVEFLSSVALAQLIGLNRTVRAAGGQLQVKNLRPAIHRVFTMARLDRVLDFEPAPQTP